MVLSLLYCHVTCTVYYVIPTIGNQSCATDQECHTLSYYINTITLPSNVTLLFINGEHLLKENEVLHIKDLNNVTLLGQGQWVQSFYQSVIQSRVIIKCIYNTSIAINVYATIVIYINGLTITHCSRGIVIDLVSDAQLNNLFVHNNIEYGFLITNTTTVIIDSCSLSYNGINALLDLVKSVYISYSNFTYGQNNGLFIQNGNNFQGSNITIAINTCIVYSNVGYGAYVYSNNSRNYTIVVQNTIFSNNNGGIYTIIISVHSEVIISGVKCLYNKATRTYFTGGAILHLTTEFNNTIILQDTAFIGNNKIGLWLFLSGHRSFRTLINNTRFLSNFRADTQIVGAYI